MHDIKAHLVAGLLVNALFLIPYIWILSSGARAPEWLALPCMLWGFIGFRWIGRNLLGGMFMHVDVSFMKFFFVLMMGTIIYGAFGFLIIPAIMVYQTIQLVALQKNP